MRIDLATEIITRAQSRALGRKRYFDGTPCKYGHVAERQTCNTLCVECGRMRTRVATAKRDPAAERERLRKWREANREKLRAKAAAANERPEVKARQAAWYQANRDRLAEDRKANAGKHRASNIASAKAWNEANPEKAREHFRLARRKRRARAKDAGGTHTLADLAEILTAQGNRCAYCRCSLAKAEKHVDHIQPLARGGSNGRENLQYLCRHCNQAKSAKDPIEYAQSLGLLL